MIRFNEQVYSIVDKIPCGKVVSYGQIAWMLGRPRGARLVGRAMRYCPEGVPFLSDGRVDMKSCLWNSEDQ